MVAAMVAHYLIQQTPLIMSAFVDNDKDK